MGAANDFLHNVVMKYEGDDCLIWPHRKHERGTPHIKIKGRIILATRLVCKMTHGPAPTPKHQAAHLCGKGHLGCINPKHLVWKTATENQADRILHGTTNRGERNGQARLTLKQVHEIRRLRGRKTQREIAKTYGVSPSTIGMLLTGRSWANV